MLQSLNKAPEAAPCELLALMKSDIDAFVGEAPQSDDITMLALRYHGSGGEEWKECSFPASREQLSQVQQFVTTQLDGLSCPPQSLIQLEVAVEEIFVNVANYAYPAENPGSVTVRCRLEKDPLRLTVVFCDSGVPFDPLAKPDADITLSTQDRPIGGLGILMVKKSMDIVSYAYENGENVLTIQKILTGTGTAQPQIAADGRKAP
jgi:anti-sigma regulatory factor (Ser/Thr protein kinase)